MSYDISKIRNFSIIAHIDHGKSTLSDRIIEVCGAVDPRNMSDRILDTMDIEKERGITIKSQTVRLKYLSNDGDLYVFNLMDTPGHVDFGYEVSRCLAACEGSVLLVDSTQGVQAQTVANAYKAIESDNEIVVALNKIDLPASDIKKTSEEIETIIGIKMDEKILVSGKTGSGVKELLEEIIKKIPAPKGKIDSKLKCLLVDAHYDPYLGVVMLIKVIDGEIKKDQKIKMLSNLIIHNVENVGIFSPTKKPVDSLRAGEVGYITAGIKKLNECNIGDTIVLENDLETKGMPGFKKLKPSVYCSIYPVDSSDYHKLKDTLEKLQLNDSSIFFETESSNALGLGFRCGFLGLLHLDVINQRLTEEFDLDIVTTAPSVIYKVHLSNGDVLDVDNPAKMADQSYIKFTEEPIVLLTIISDADYLGPIVSLCMKKRGLQLDTNINGRHLMMKFEIPLAEIIFDFHDKLKSISKGYASFESEFLRYEKSDTVKVSILVNGEQADSLSFLTDRSTSEQRGRALCSKLKEELTRQMFAIPIQAAIGGKIIARETISAYRKDVTAKCYGGDITRRKKLLEKQKAGKAKMKAVGSVEIPHSAYLAVLKISDES